MLGLASSLPADPHDVPSHADRMPAAKQQFIRDTTPSHWLEWTVTGLAAQVHMLKVRNGPIAPCPTRKQQTFRHESTTTVAGSHKRGSQNPRHRSLKPSAVKVCRQLFYAKQRELGGLSPMAAIAAELSLVRASRLCS